MQKITLKYGFISGIIVSVIMLITMNYYSHCDGDVNWNTSLIIGYASMLLAFSMVYFGIKNYRDQYNNGVISFGKAFQIGILIVFIAATMYVLSWLICYIFFMPDFMEKYGARELESLQATGASAVLIEAKQKENAEMLKMYNNPFFNAMFTYLEILPVGLIVTLICSLILKRKQ